MDPVTLSCFLLFNWLVVQVGQTNAQVPMAQNPSFHRVQYVVGPDGDLGNMGPGRELDRFFNGLGDNGGRRGRNSIAGSPWSFRPMIPAGGVRSFRFFRTW